MSPDLHHLSGAYAVDALDIDERAAFEQHLSVCSACQSDVHELTEAAHSLAALADTAPPAALRTAVLAGIAQVRPLPPLVDDETTSDLSTSQHARTPETLPVGGEAGAAARHAKVIPLFRRRTTWIASAAAAAVLAVGGVGAATWIDSRPPELTAVQQVEQAPDAATVTRSQGGFTATLAYSRSLDQSALTVSGMPAAPDGKTYQLWYVGSDEIARSAGFIDPRDGSGQAVLQGDLSRAAAVGVTVEPSGGSTEPTTEPIMVMALA